MKFVILTENREQWDTLMHLLISLGYVWHRDSDNKTDVEEIGDEYYDRYKSINIYPQEKNISGAYSGGIDFAKNHVSIINSILNIKFVVITDVGGYNAIVDGNNIKVGCQTITPAKFRELMEAVKTVRDKH